MPTYLSPPQSPPVGLGTPLSALQVCRSGLTIRTKSANPERSFPFGELNGFVYHDD